MQLLTEQWNYIEDVSGERIAHIRIYRRKSFCALETKVCQSPDHSTSHDLTQRVSLARTK